MKLTDEQRKIVEENHNLIYSYCKYKKLNIDEYYGDLAIALCKVVINYNNQKSKISTYIYKAFDNTVLNKFKYENKNKKHNLQILSKDRAKVITKIKSYEKATDRINYNITNDILNKSDVGKLLLKGYNQNEIMKKLNKSKFLVSKEIERLKKKIENEIIR